MRFLPDILPAHPEAPEAFPSHRHETAQRWEGALAQQRKRRRFKIMRNLREQLL